jgi:hypothetical protein
MRRACERIADEVRAVRGTADLYRLLGRDGRQQADIVALFDRGTDYAALLRAMASTGRGDAKALRSLRRDLAALVAIDYFPGEAQRQAQAALAALEAAAGGEPLARQVKFAVSPAPTFRGGPGPRAKTSGWIAWPRPG